MKLYLVHGHAKGATFFQWVGSQAECATARKAFVSEFGAKRADIITDEIEVPTNKQGLIDFLNKGQHT